MIWVREIEYCVAQHNQQLFVLPHEHASERMILRFSDDALSGPLPELGLGCPELFGVTADYKSCVLSLLSLFFLLLLFAQSIPTSAQSVWIGLIDFHYYSFRMFARWGVSALASDLERGCFITLQACTVLKQGSLRYTTVFNLKNDCYGLRAKRSCRLP